VPRKLTLDLASDGLSLDRPPSRLSAISTFFARSFPTPQVTPGVKPKSKTRKSTRPRPRSSRSSSHSHRQSVRSYFSSPLSRNGDEVSNEDTDIAPVPSLPLPIPMPTPIPPPHPVAYAYDRSVDPSSSLECDDNDVSEELRDSDHADLDLRRISDFFAPTLGRLSLHTVFGSAVSPPWARDPIDSLSDSGATQGSEDGASVQGRIGGEWPRECQSESSRGRVGSDRSNRSDSPDASHVHETEDIGSVGPIVMSHPRDMPTRSLTHPGTNALTAATAGTPATHSEPVAAVSHSSSSSDTFVASRRSRAYGRPGLFRDFKTYLSPIAASPTSNAAPSRHASRTLSTLSAFSGLSTFSSATATGTASRDRNGAGHSGMPGIARTIYPVYTGSQTISDTSQAPPVPGSPPASLAPDRPNPTNEYGPPSKARRDARKLPGLALSREATTPSLWLDEGLNPSRSGGTSSVNTIPTTAKTLALFSPDTSASAYGGLEEVGL
jgi:hypothetical protein